MFRIVCGEVEKTYCSGLEKTLFRPGTTVTDQAWKKCHCPGPEKLSPVQAWKSCHWSGLEKMSLLEIICGYSGAGQVQAWSTVPALDKTLLPEFLILKLTRHSLCEKDQFAGVYRRWKRWRLSRLWQLLAWECLYRYKNNNSENSFHLFLRMIE